jgi:hypothetical protein
MKKLLSLITWLTLITSTYANDTIYIVFVYKLHDNYVKSRESKLFETRDQAKKYINKKDTNNIYKSKEIIEFVIIK